MEIKANLSGLIKLLGLQKFQLKYEGFTILTVICYERNRIQNIYQKQRVSNNS